MSFSDHKITAFTHKIADLPDQPNLPADELKARFDSSPEELRQSVNGICDDAARLEARVDGIIAETFGDTIDKEMLSDELAAELDAKAVESSVSSRFATAQASLTAEQTARQSADANLQDQIDALQTSKATVYFTTYTGTGGDRSITLSIQPQIVIIASDDYSPLTPNAPLAIGQGRTAYFGSRKIATLYGTTLTLTDAAGFNDSGTHFAVLAIA